MKTTIKHHFTTKLYGTLLIGCTVILLSFIAAPANTDLSGTWILNPSKSDFGDSPTFVLSKQIELTGDKAALNIKHVLQTKSGKDSTINLRILFGRTLDIITADQRTRHYQVAWIDNGQQLQIEYSSSFSDKPDAEEYHTIERYHLATDARELILDKQVKVYNGETYAVKGVYDKQ